MSSDALTEPHPGAERHASWAELFFDLVVVAGVAALAHVLAVSLEVEAVTLYVVVFLAFWFTWVSFTLYGNTAADRTEVLRLLVGMAGLGVMAAAVPGTVEAVLHGETSPGTTVLAVAYVLARFVGAQSWERGQVVLDFPVAQHVVATLPWLVSVFTPEAWLLPLWIGGIVLDLVLVAVVSGPEMLEKYQHRFEQVLGRRAHRPARPGRAPLDAERFRVTGVSADTVHLAERLGLFVIIVLGEGVVQVVDALGETELGRTDLVAALVCFTLLATLFGLSVVFGWAGVPHLRPGSFGLRPALVLHGLTSALLAAVAVALAEVTTAASEPLADEVRWLLAAAVAGYFLLGLAAGVRARGFHLAAVAAWSVSGIAAPLLVAALGSGWAGTWVVTATTLAVLAHLGWEVAARRRALPKLAQ